MNRKVASLRTGSLAIAPGLACGALLAGTTADAGTFPGAVRAVSGTEPRCSAHTLAVRIADPGPADDAIMLRWALATIVP